MVVVGAGGGYKIVVNLCVGLWLCAGIEQEQMFTWVPLVVVPARLVVCR